MRRLSRLVVVALGTVLFVFVGGAPGLPTPGGGSAPDDAETPVPRADLTRAGKAALDATGGTRVTDAEVEGEDIYYEIEVVLENGRRVAVHLDESFVVVRAPTGRADVRCRRLIPGRWRGRPDDFRTGQPPFRKPVHSRGRTNTPALEADMKRSRKIIAGTAFVAALAGGAGVAAAAGGSEDANEGPDVAITGDALQRASEAALAETGGGRVTGTEVGDEESYYEVEVTRDDGSQVDVQLDESFTVVGSAADSEDADEGAELSAPGPGQQSAQGRRHAPPHRPAVEQQHLGQVVSVGLADPGAAGDLAGQGQLVAPAPGRRIREQLFTDLSPVLGIDPVAVVLERLGEHEAGGDRLAEHPVHAGPHDDVAVPVDVYGKPRCPSTAPEATVKRCWAPSRNHDGGCDVTARTCMASRAHSNRCPTVTPYGRNGSAGRSRLYSGSGSHAAVKCSGSRQWNRRPHSVITRSVVRNACPRSRCLPAWSATGSASAAANVASTPCMLALRPR